MTNYGEPLLILDVSALAHRASYAPKGKPLDLTTAVLHGVVRDVVTLQDRFRTPRVAFCFDGGCQRRIDLYPQYKHAKANTAADPVEAHRRKEVHRQLNILRNELLPALGFRNLFHAPGYEGDDLVAALVRDLKRTDEENIIVGNDRDLWQLLDGNTKMFNPRDVQLRTLQTFHADWGILPPHWVDVKALAGDGKGKTGDCIPGAAGVGEATAAKFVRGELKSGKALDSVRAWLASSQWQINLQLIRLPFPGTPQLTLREDETSRTTWRSVLTRYKLDGLVHLLPVNVKRT